MLYFWTGASKRSVHSWWWYTGWSWEIYSVSSRSISSLWWVFLKVTSQLATMAALFPPVLTRPLTIPAYYIIFLTFDNPLTPKGVDDSMSNPMPSPSESVMAMFLMSLTNFGDYYGAFERTDHEIEAKVRSLTPSSKLPNRKKIVPTIVVYRK